MILETLIHFVRDNKNEIGSVVKEDGNKKQQANAFERVFCVVSQFLKTDQAKWVTVSVFLFAERLVHDFSGIVFALNV